ncbi:MAG: 50S ribosomal protein L17 [Saprospiraceae bacterium]
MRHNKKFNHLGRKKGHRRALLANMAISIIEHKRITTTLAKAKALRVYLEPLVTKAKEDSVHQRRTAFRYLQNKEAIKELFGPIREKVGDRPGGYLRIFKIGNRQGDNAEMAIIEFVDFNETLLSAKEEGTKKRRTRRSRRSGGNNAAETTTETTVEDAADNTEEKTEE